MIGNEYPCAAGCLGFGQELYKSLKEIFPILVVSEYLTKLYPTSHDVMQYTGSLPEADKRRAKLILASFAYTISNLIKQLVLKERYILTLFITRLFINPYPALYALL